MEVAAAVAVHVAGDDRAGLPMKSKASLRPVLMSASMLRRSITSPWLSGLKSWMTSRFAPTLLSETRVKRNVSAPEPPTRKSEPEPPTSRSLPEPPKRSSLPLPP